jgi:choline dehydrogenase-like flavoprotein
MIDDAKLIENGTSLHADICVIGGGAAGISLALEFLRQERSVLVVESGSWASDEATQSLYEGDVVDEALHSPLHTYRQRRFGGSTTIWGGRCTPLDPIDFERRPYMPASGWPFGYETLLPYYPRANELCEAGEFAYSAASAFPQGMRPIIEGFASDRLTTDTLERFSCPTDFARRYGHRLRASRNVRVLLNANCTEIQLSPDGGRVESIVVRTLTGRRFSIAASYVVLATGGLEVARLLLASRGVHGNGIGNGRDLVGRYYMCHVAGTVGTLTINGPSSRVHHGYELSPDGIYCRRRIAFPESVQRELGIGNFIARLHHPRITDPEHRSGPLSALYLARHFIAYEYGKRLHGGDHAPWSDWMRHVRNVVTDPITTADFVLHLVRKRFLAPRKFPSIIVQPPSGRFSIDFHAEQQPNPESRVQLCTQRDRLGMPRLRVDWRYSAIDVHTVAEAFRVMAEELARSGCGRLNYEPDTLERSMVRDGAYGGHHIGTARMGASPSTSVVDSDCRVHDLHNLFIAGSAVFPTSGQGNPTLTIVALALRLADHLKRLAGRALAQVQTQNHGVSQRADAAIPSASEVLEKQSSASLLR